MRGRVIGSLTLLVGLLGLSGCPAATGPKVAGGAVGTGSSGVAAGPAEVVVEEGWTRLDLEPAMALSVEHNLPLFLYFYTKWCGPCKELSEKVFPQPQFQQFAATMVSVRIDGHQEGAGIAAAERYGIHSYPTMVVCRPGGEEIERFFGFSRTEEYIATIRDYLEGRNTASDYRDRALKSPDDLALAFAAGRELAIRQRGNEAIPFLERVWRAAPDDSTGNVPRALLMLAKTVYLDTLNEPAKALPLLEELYERFPDSYHGSEASYMIARVYLESNRRAEAERFLKEKVRIAPHDAIQFFRFGSFCLQHSFLLEEGAVRLEEGIKLHPEAAYLWKTLADVRFRLKQYEEAVAAMEQAARLDPATEAYGKLVESFRAALERSRKAP